MVYKEDTDRPVFLKKKNSVITINDTEIEVISESKLDTNTKAPMDQEGLDRVINAKNPSKAKSSAKKEVSVNKSLTKVLESQKERNEAATKTLKSEDLLLKTQIGLENSKKQYSALVNGRVNVEDLLPLNKEEEEGKIGLELLALKIKEAEERLRTIKIANDKEAASIDGRNSTEILKEKAEAAQYKEDIYNSNKNVKMTRGINDALFEIDKVAKYSNIIHSETVKRVDNLMQDRGYNSYDEIIAAKDSFTASLIDKIWSKAEEEISKL